MRSIPLLFILGASLVGCDAAGSIDPAAAPFNAKNPFEPGAPKLGDRACAIDETSAGTPSRHLDIAHDADGHIVRTLERDLTFNATSETVRTWVDGRLASESYGSTGLPPDVVTTFVRNPQGAVVRAELDGATRPSDPPADGRPDAAWFTEYDERGLPTRILDDRDADGQPEDGSTELVFDARELLVLRDYLAPDSRSTTSLTYDDAGRLTDSATDTTGDGVADTTEHRTYDAAGRLLTVEFRGSIIYTESYEYVGDGPDPVRQTNGTFERRWTYDCAAQ